jgi:hypothetical protein
VALSLPRVWGLQVCARGEVGSSSRCVLFIRTGVQAPPSLGMTLGHLMKQGGVPT